MVFVYGGAYQGKLRFVQTNYSFAEQDYFYCTIEDEPTVTAKVLVGYEQWVLGQIRKDGNPLEWLEAYLIANPQVVIIAQDMSCGIVPIAFESRMWLKEMGKCACALSEKSEKVYRLFCGIATKIK